MTNIILNRLLFVAEIWGAGFMFACRLRKRDRFLLRLICGILVSMGVAILLGLANSNAWITSLIFMAMFVMIVLLMKLCYDEPWQNIIFCGIAAYTTQHFAYEFANLFLTLITDGASPLLGTYGTEIIEIGDDWQFVWLSFYASIYVLCYYVAYCGAYFVFGRQIGSESDLKIKNFKLLLIVGVGLLVDILLNALFVHSDFVTIDSDSIVLISLMIYVYNCLCCALLLTVQFGLVMQRKLAAELDLAMSLSKLRAEQYAVSKENIDIINQKCHDMKHQIRMIGHTNSLPQDVVDEIEHSINIYDASVKTGNEVLDTILTEKNLRCVANNILMSCVADGACISFIKDSDLCALFGNALDNAIEAVMKVEDAEKRVIELILYERCGLISLNISNTFVGEVKLVNGFPITMKSDLHLHGFGVKSMQIIVERYGGEITVSAQDNIFGLSILIPVPIEPEKKEKVKIIQA